MKSICLFIFLLSGYLGNASPVHELLDRIDPGASKKFKIELVEGNTDFLSWIRMGTGWLCGETIMSVSLLV